MFFIGAMLGMVLPGILYVTFLRGKSLEEFGVAAALADAMGNQFGALLGIFIAFIGAWILFKTQLDTLEGMVRGLTDVVWTGWHRMGDRGEVRMIYYPMLALIVVMGLIILRLPQPIALLSLGANMAGVIFVVFSLHILKLNTKFLPKEVQPPTWRKVSLVCMAIFYGVFVWLFVLGAPPWNILFGDAPGTPTRGSRSTSSSR